MTLVVDRAAVDADVARRRQRRENGFAAWLGLRFAISLATFYAIAWVVKLLMHAPSLRDMPGWTLTGFLGVPAFMAFMVTAAAERLTFSDAALDSNRVAARLDRELEHLTGPRWPSRLLRSALWLALCAGAVLVVVVQWTGHPALLARGSDQAIAVFVTATLLVSLVLVFAIRAAALYANRTLISRAPASRDSGTSLQHPSGSGSGSA